MKQNVLWAILFSAIAAVFGTFALSPSTRPLILPAPAWVGPGSSSKGERPVPSFALTDQAGWSFDSESLRGSVWIADFIFTSCAGSCPRMSEQMALLQKRLPAAVQMVSITVDPKRDSPAALAEYARRYGAQEGRWHFLTGSADEIAQIVQKGFRLSYAEGGSPEEPVTHSSRFVLVDRGGFIRGYYDSTDPPKLEQLIRDAGSL